MIMVLKILILEGFGLKIKRYSVGKLAALDCLPLVVKDCERGIST